MRSVATKQRDLGWKLKKVKCIEGVRSRTVARLRIITGTRHCYYLPLADDIANPPQIHFLLRRLVFATGTVDGNTQ